MNPSNDDVLPKMTAIWQEILGAETVDPTDNFFMLGGDSLKAAALMVHIEETFDLLVDPIEIFERPVLADFAALVAEQSAGASGSIEEGVL